MSQPRRGSGGTVGAPRAATMARWRASARRAPGPARARGNDAGAAWMARASRARGTRTPPQRARRCRRPPCGLARGGGGGVAWKHTAGRDRWRPLPWCCWRRRRVRRPAAATRRRARRRGGRDVAAEADRARAPAVEAERVVQALEPPSVEAAAHFGAVDARAARREQRVGDAQAHRRVVGPLTGREAEAVAAADERVRGALPAVARVGRVGRGQEFERRADRVGDGHSDHRADRAVARRRGERGRDERELLGLVELAQRLGARRRRAAPPPPSGGAVAHGRRRAVEGVERARYGAGSRLGVARGRRRRGARRRARARRAPAAPRPPGRGRRGARLASRAKP